MRKDQTDVLIVGAGPVGLWTAVLLAEAGIATAIIDREARSAARSYACALHPRTLKLLRRLGLAEAVLSLGRRIPSLCFYDGASRRAEIQLAQIDPEFPFLLVLPQNAFEQVLEQHLNRAGIEVNWNHRFDTLHEADQGVTAIVEELSGTGTGYIVPHWETVVKDQRPIQAQFLVGTDGHNSLVSQRLGIQFERFAKPEFFAAYEFESDAPLPDEARVVLDDTTANVLWPLPGNKCRWTFQLIRSDTPADFPEKERRAVRIARPAVDETIRHYIQKVAAQRAPWFSAKVTGISWCAQVVFEQRLARQFGRNRCWLAGDAVHQTGPVGVQSMNIGFCEAELLAGCLRKILREKAPLSLLASYESESRKQWQQMLVSGLKSGSETDPWVSERSRRLLPCLPGSNGDLARLAAQLKLHFP